MLIRPELLALNLDVADDATGTYKQKVHRAELHVPIGGTGAITLDVWLTAYARAADGGYGAALPPERVPVRRVPLVASAAAAVNPAGKVCYRLLVPGRVRDMQTGAEIVLPEGQDFAAFLDALPDPYLLQDEAMAATRDQDEVCVRAFVEKHIRAADAAPSSFA